MSEELTQSTIENEEKLKKEIADAQSKEKRGHSSLILGTLFTIGVIIFIILLYQFPNFTQYF